MKTTQLRHEALLNKVQEQLDKGVPIGKALARLGVPRQRYYLDKKRASQTTPQKPSGVLTISFGSLTMTKAIKRLEVQQDGRLVIE